MKTSFFKSAAVIACLFLAPLSGLAQDSGLETAQVKIKPDTPLPGAAVEAPVIQIALLLDTSSSMNSLIDQAKTQLWRIVNEFITAKQDGKTPAVQVALYEYGNNRLSGQSNWVRMVQPLSRDLDKLSQELFALRSTTISGSNEYCGAVISNAARSLSWSPSSSIYKAIFIAGNEPFTNGPILPKLACREAISKGIIVNTIFCGTETGGISGGWKQGALSADGSFMAIEHNQVVAHIDAPQDATIVRLNAELNGTYIAFGLLGEEAKHNQIAQDNNAEQIDRGTLSSRVRTKASSQYHNPTWDIVDASRENNFDWGKVKKEQLPKDLQNLSTEELKAEVARKQIRRAELQQQILELSGERDSYVAKKRKEWGADRSFGGAMVKVVRKQAESKGVKFEQPDK